MKKEMEKTEDKPNTVQLYYGKKLYHANPMLVRKKTTNEKIPDYRDEESEFKPSSNHNT